MFKYSLISILFFFLFQNCSTFNVSRNKVSPQNELSISHLDDQWLFEGTQIQFFVDAIHQELNDVIFKLEKAPSFVKLIHNKGQARILVNAPLNSMGNYSFNLVISKGNLNAVKKINLLIKKQPKATTFYNKDSILNNLNPNIEKLILFKNGNYFQLKFDVKSNKKIYFMPKANAEVNIDQIVFNNCKHLIIKGFTINGTQIKKDQAFIEIDSTNTHISIENCLIGNKNESKKWSESDWKLKVRRGLYAWSTYTTLSNNKLSCTFHAIETKGKNSLVKYNIIDRFSGDAIRNTASHCTFKFNTLKNAVIADYYEKGGNHDDLYQSWTFDNPIEYVNISDNIAISYLDQDLKYPSKIVQGIVNFDGFSNHWTIKNNLVILDHPHGITLLGANNCIIESNIVARNPLQWQDFEADPWIMIDKKKDGQTGINNVIKNNTVPILKLDPLQTRGVANDIYGSEKQLKFQGYENWNFTLLIP